MKKNFLYTGLMALVLGTSFTACSSDDDGMSDEEKAQNLEYTSENAAAWGNYAVHVANLLESDANKLNNEWVNSYAESFKNHDAESGFESGADCVDQMIDGMVDIANEVGTSKIGEPYDFFKAGQTNKALYAVESWYSFHSREDYYNNILSIARSLAGTRVENDFINKTLAQAIADGDVVANSILGHCYNTPSLREAGENVWNNTIAAWNAIYNIPQPFRNNIGSAQTQVAMDACATLSASLEGIKTNLHNSFEDDAVAEAIAKQFVDVVVLPTYSDLAAKNAALAKAVRALQANPSNEAFEKACEAWMEARKPWETSEAFLFGPVAELGLDPNMDSWPLDAVGISNLLKSQNWSDMEWSGDFNEDSDAIGAAQSLRGFHTLEFLLYKNGNPRKVK